MKDKKIKKRRRFGAGRVLINLFIVIYVVLLLWLILPLISFVGNTKDNDTDAGESIVSEGDVVIDMSELTATETPTEEPSETPYATADMDKTPLPTETSEPTSEDIDNNDSNVSSGDAVPYQPDPIVEGVTKVTGSTIHLEEDAKNILILGYESSSLTDTIIICSISDSKNTIQLVSLSRDAYVPYTGAVKEFLISSGMHNEPGAYKLNECYNIGKLIHYSGGKFGNSGIDFLCHIIQEMMPDANMDIDDYIFLDEEGFPKMIDLFGGADVYITEDYYNGNGQLIWEKGYHHLNGDEASAYIHKRYRYTANGLVSSTGDPYRKANQLKFIMDFAKANAVTPENLTRVPEIMESLNGILYHSINTVSDITMYTKCGYKYVKGQYEIKSYVVTGTSIDPLHDGASYVNLMR